jgi:23S rRNA G2069 N7-methylase RlmK/C1962 C5-methylase RlmI
MINGEGDVGGPVDRYGEVLVLQCLTAGAERRKPWLPTPLADAAVSTSSVSAGSVR